MNQTYDVAVLGTGIVAHALALLLARERMSVALVGPAPDLTQAAAPDIRAYALNHASRNLLQSLKAWPAPSAVTAVRQMLVSEPAANDSATLHFQAPTPDDALAWVVDVPALENTLDLALQFQPHIERMPAAPSARLTVICEGRHSATRQSLGFDYEVRPYGHTAVAARVNCDQPHGSVARQWFVNGAVLALLPMGGNEGRMVAVVWSVAHDRAQELLGAAEDEFVQQLAQACDSALGTMRLLGRPAAWPLQLALARHWVRPGLALAGDAAHAMHPLAGQGLNLGLGDVATLASILQQREYWRGPGDLRLLRRYERARKAEFERMACVTDGLYGLFGQQDSRIQTLRRWGLRNFDRLTPLKRWSMTQASGRNIPRHNPRNP